MDRIGLDLHTRETQLCILTEDGELEERRIATTRERCTAVLGRRAPARILLEASTESEWVARHLESLGHEVIIADPGFAPMYATRSKRVKTDKRDARTLAEACRLGAYRPIHRVSEPQRHLRAELAPIVTLFGPLNAEIAAADRRLTSLATDDPLLALLQTAPTIGPITALGYVAALDDVTRFTRAHQVEAYLGLVPSEHSSGERQHRGRITKRGNPPGSMASRARG